MCWPSAESRRLQIAALDPATYRRHPIHGAERVWAETNCYTDLLIELAHGLGFESTAALELLPSRALPSAQVRGIVAASKSRYCEKHLRNKKET